MPTIICPKCGRKFSRDSRDRISKNVAGCEECTPKAPPGKTVLIRCARCKENVVDGWEIGGDILLCAACADKKREEARKVNPFRDWRRCGGKENAAASASRQEVGEGRREEWR